jgi:hypothetical protein
VYVEEGNITSKCTELITSRKKKIREQTSHLCGMEVSKIETEGRDYCEN